MSFKASLRESKWWNLGTLRHNYATIIKNHIFLLESREFITFIEATNIFQWFLLLVLSIIAIMSYKAYTAA